MDPFQGKMSAFQSMHGMSHNPRATGMGVHGHGSGAAYMMPMDMKTRSSAAQIDSDRQQNSKSTTPTTPNNNDYQETPPASPSMPQSIPLTCCICPKNSTFSDISHLLTHVSSKGHLAKKFNCELAANESEVARKTLQDFQIWYDKYNIRQLLQNRNQSRNQRVTKGRGRGAMNTATTTSRRGKAGNAATGASSRSKKVRELIYQRSWDTI
jgi:hypothetical protein